MKSGALFDGLATVTPITAKGVAPQGEAMGAALHRVALTVNSSLDIKEVLRRLAELTLEAIPADRCSMFLLDESRTKLVPTLSIGHLSDEGLWETFRSLDPVDLKEVPERWRFFKAGRALGIPDMAASRIVPPRIIEIFGTRSAILVPLIASGEPQGLLALDWTGPGRLFDNDELLLIEAIGSYASLAIRNARLYEELSINARSQQSLVEVAGALNSSLSLRSVLDLVCSAFDDLLAPSHCSVNLIDRPHSRIETLEVRGVAWFTRNPESIEAVPKDEIDRVREGWLDSPGPIVYSASQLSMLVGDSALPSGVQSAALFPLMREGDILGFVMAGFPGKTSPGRRHLETAQALADLASTAIARAQLHEHLRLRLHRLEILYRLSDVVAGHTDLSGALKELNRATRPELGIWAKSICLTSAQLRETVGGLQPVKEEMEAIRSWRGKLGKGLPAIAPRRAGADWLVPIVLKRRVLGALRVTLENPLDSSDQGLLNAIGSGIAEIIFKAGLRKNLSESDRRLAIAAERERIGRDLHDSVVHLFNAMGTRLSTWAPQAPDEEWRDRLEELKSYAGQGTLEVRQAIHSLLFLDVRRKGLVASLKDLASKFEAATGIELTMRLEGDPVLLIPSREDALFRVAHEALVNIERHSRASMASIVLTYKSTEVSLSVRDDGVGLARRDPFDAPSGHFGLRGLQSQIQEAGGTLAIKNACPRGVKVEARFLLKAKVAGGAR